MWGYVVALVISLIVSYALTPKPQNAKPSGLKDLQLPTADEGGEIPVLFGTRDMAPNILWYGDLVTEAIRRDGVTIGYRYLLGMHMAACLGPVDALRRISFDERAAWQGYSAGGRLVIDQPALFGGSEREGGVGGEIDVEMGGADQGRNDYLLANASAQISAHRGVLGLVLRRCYLGNSPYLKPLSLRAQRVLVRHDGRPQWYPEKALIAAAQPVVAGPGTALYVMLDLSVSTAETASNGQTRWANISTAVSALLDEVLARVEAGTGVHDVMLVAYGADINNQALRQTILRRDVDAADVAALQSWLAARTPTYALSQFSAATIDAPGFFSGAPSGAQRRAIFVQASPPMWLTQGESAAFEDPLTAASDATSAAATLLGIEGVESFAVHLSPASDLVQTRKMDNTPGDGVPAVGAGDVQSLTAALLYALRAAAGGLEPIDQRDLNPAHLLRELLTDADWGVGEPEELIDDAAFAAAADVLYAEGFGLSFVWSQQQPAEEMAQTILNHIDGNLFVDRSTGKWVLHLARADYDAEDLLLLDEDSIDRVEDAARPMFGELTTSVTVTYWDHVTGKDGTLTVSDPALSTAQGVQINAAVQYPGITNGVLASRVASRDLRTLSLPRLSCTVYAHRVADQLHPGAVFRLTWPDLRVQQMVMRVVDVALGDGRSNQVRIRCVQDVFGLPASAVVLPPTGGWTDPRQPPIASPYSLAVELPYHELVQAERQDDVDADLAATPDFGALAVAAIRPTAGTLNAAVLVDEGAGYVEMPTPLDFAPGGQLGAAVTASATVLPLVGAKDLDLLLPGTHAQLGAELVGIVSVSGASVTVLRGVLDTTPRAHAAGTWLVGWDRFHARDAGEVYLASQTLSAKVLPVTGLGRLPAASAGAVSVEMAARAIRPYPPAGLRINGALEPVELVGDADLTWAGRNRLTQAAGPLLGWLSAHVAPEVGTTYTVRVTAVDSGAVLHLQDGITDEAYVLPADDLAAAGSGAVRIEVWSVRDGWASWQTAMQTVGAVVRAPRADELGTQRIDERGTLRGTE